MIFFENFKIALKAIFSNKMRSILTTIGIIIGVGAVVGVVAIVQGLSHMISQELQGVGATYIIVFPEHDPNNPEFSGKDIRITMEDAREIEKYASAVEYLTPIIWRAGYIHSQGRKWSGFYIGVNENYPFIVNHYVEKGRFITKEDIEGRKKVAVIGRTLVKELKLFPDPIGKEVVVQGNPLTVIGVMEKKGQMFGNDQDSVLILPYTTAQIIFGEISSRQMRLDIKAKSPEVAELAKEQIRETLRKTHKIPEGKPEDFRIMLQEEILSTVSKILGSITLVVAAVVGISLLVGGVGIMNIMLVSVTERTKEIGLRKAVGARKKDILIQFLIEAVTLSLVGGVIGVGFGFLLGMGGAKLIPNFPSAHIPLWAIGLALSFAGAVGVFFGIYPAYKASSLHPIEALRYE